MQHLLSAVDKNHQLILDAHNYIWTHPETGFREWKTSEYLEKAYTALGYRLTRAQNIPGFYTVIDTGRPGPQLLILGELDSLICPQHKDADPETGAVHACGHSAQSAALLGIAAALKEPGALDGMCGKIRLCAVPAEELIEIGYRKELQSQGTIRYLGGKTEFLHRGYFDDVDLAFMVHSSSVLSYGLDHVGCVAKKIIYQGKAAHAGGAPWAGLNALYAATQGLNAVNALRETFKESDYIRFHPIVTEGGVAVNAIPETAVIESYVRGRSFQAIGDVNRRVNRALCGSALSLGVNINIEDDPGYSPLVNDKQMRAVAKEAAEFVFHDMDLTDYETFSTGSTDMGDLSGLIPVVHPTAPGASGIPHGADYQISDVEAACVKSAKWQLAMAYILLSNGAARAKQIIREFKPLFASKEEFFQTIDALCSSGNRIVYHGEDGAEVKW